MSLDPKTIEYYRSLFPITKDYIYLDHAGVAPVSTSVCGAAHDFMVESSEHGIARYEQWTGRIDEVRGRSAEITGAKDTEIAFIKNTSHGISIVASGLEWKEGDNVIVYERDFPSNIYPWLNLKSLGVELRYFKATNNRIDIKVIAGLMDSRTRVVSVTSVQSNNGFMIDLGRLGALCKRNDTLLFVDAIQSLGAVPMDVGEMGIDFMAADAHKWLLGPEGIGIFYCREELAPRIEPCLIGWKSVVGEDDFETIDLTLKDNTLRFEEGSPNIAGIYALGAALDLLLEVGVREIKTRIDGLVDVIISEVQKRGLTLISPRDANERGGIAVFRGGFDPADIRTQLQKRNIIVNTRGGALRLSPHFYNTEDEIKAVFSALDNLTSN